VLEEGERTSVRAVEVQGNTKTRLNVIARELALGPGEVFDLARMRVSEARLRNTQFFEEVRLAPVPTAVPGQSDLRITVKEGNTGSVSFGAGYSTVEQLVGFVEYAEGNFDYTNPEGWYRGGGQKLRLRVSVGNLSNTIEHSFEEPALWDRDLAVGYIGRATIRRLPVVQLLRAHPGGGRVRPPPRLRQRRGPDRLRPPSHRRG